MMNQDEFYALPDTAVIDRLDSIPEDDPWYTDAPEDNFTDVEADADTLASAGWGTDEDYGYYGEEDAGYEYGLFGDDC